MTRVTPACMGGWCTHRTHCAHYYSGARNPVERLCPKGDPHPVEYMPRVKDSQLPAPLRDDALDVF